MLFTYITATSAHNALAPTRTATIPAYKTITWPLELLNSFFEPANNLLPINLFISETPGLIVSPRSRSSIDRDPSETKKLQPVAHPLPERTTSALNTHAPCQSKTSCSYSNLIEGSLPPRRTATHPVAPLRQQGPAPAPMTGGSGSVVAEEKMSVSRSSGENFKKISRFPLPSQGRGQGVRFLNSLSDKKNWPGCA